MAIAYVAPPGQAGGGDSGARAAGFKDYADYQLAVDRDKDAGGGNSSPSFSSSFSGVSDPIQTAQQLVKFTQQANQPAIGSLQASIDPLTQRYNDLLTSIKGQGTVASNAATQATTLDLGRRGLLPTSQEGQQAISNAQLPVTQATSGALAQAGLGEQQDINQINQAIALLQTGNPEQAVNLASNLYNSQQQYQTQLQLGSIANMFKEYGYGGGVVNTQTGQTVGGGGGGGGINYDTGATSGGISPTVAALYGMSQGNGGGAYGPGITSTPSSSDPVAAARASLGLPPINNNQSGFTQLNPYQFGNIKLR